MKLPRFALTIPRPWTWMIASRARRDWLVGFDAHHLAGQQIALHSASVGDQEGWRRFDLWVDHRIERREVVERCPHSCIVGLAEIAGVDTLPAGWRIRFGNCSELSPIGPIALGDLELWPIPALRRAQRSSLIVGLRNQIGHGDAAGVL